MVTTADLERLFGPMGAPAPLSSGDALTALREMDQAAAARLDEFAALQHGWFEPDSPPITAAAIEVTAAALIVAHRLYGTSITPPFVAPLADGGIELDWYGVAGKELMLVIPPEGAGLRFLKPIVRVQGVSFEAEGTVPADANLSELLSWLTLEP